MKAFVVIFAVLALVLSVDGKTFRTCELARALASEGVQRVLISNFVCLAEAVSNSNTRKNSTGSPTSYQLGIFQISSREYCGSNGKPGGKCNIPCEKFTDDAIKDDIQCAKRIQNDHGFKHWSRWSTRCKSNDPKDITKYLPNLLNCLHRK